MTILFLILYGLVAWFAVWAYKVDVVLPVLTGVPLLALVIFGHIAVVGVHIETSRGEHIGYVTAVEKTGLFYKTGRAFVKTDTQSSQEDMYCVMDEKVFEELKSAAQTKDRKTIKYFGYLSAGIKNCEGEGQIIYAIE